MKEYQYILEPYKGPASRGTCPSCNKRHQFSFYINTETKDRLPENVGRCNREDSCGYHFTPKQYFERSGLVKPSVSQPSVSSKKPDPVQVKEIRTIPIELLKKAMILGSTQRNCFLQYLISIFGTEVTNDLILKYLIGSSKHWEGATIFWQVDIQERARAGKIMLYDPQTGKRIKEPYCHITWVHKVLKIADYELSQCFFGEHLLAEYPDRKVAIVESEKTAVIASVYFPKFIWLATGGKNGARWYDPEVSKVLSGRDVILFPDLGAYDRWSERAEEIKQANVASIKVSDLLEVIATDEDRELGLDLADYLVKKDETASSVGWAISDNGYPVFWDYAT